MSRIGKKNIVIPDKTTVSVSGNLVLVKGPLGEISRSMPPFIEIKVTDGKVQVQITEQSKNSGKLWGTSASHIENMIEGVNSAYEKKLVVEGIGYKSEVKGGNLVLSLGLSHPVIVKIPRGIKVVSDKGVITVSGIDKEVVGQFSSDIRAFKKPEPYKGKGIRYENEVIRRKQGKKAGATA